jgi:phosphatidylserine decarboxylase
MTREGFKFLIPALAIMLILFVVGVYISNAMVLVFAVILVLISFFFVFFFRDPERKIPNGESLILSSADGRVILIKPFQNSEFMGKEGTLVSVFMSVFNVHINRVPVSGRVRYVKYNPGKFFPAFKDKASSENEQTELGLENEHGRIILKQIAGIIARRIVCKVGAGDKVQAGQRLGMIQFGSRVDLFLPEDVEIKVKLSQKVRAGETIVGIFKK